MTFELERRTLLRMLGLGAAGAGMLNDRLAAFAQGADKGADAVTIGWPSDVPSWDPNQRFTPDAQPIFKLVFDKPLDQNPRLDLVPGLSPSGIWRKTAATSPWNCATASASTTATR